MVNAVAPKVVDVIAPDPASISAIVGFLENPDASLGGDPTGARDRILRDSLGTAVAEVADKLGPDPSNWAWGKLHKAHLTMR